MDLYEKNITVLENINPALASLVAKGHNELCYEVFMDEGNLASLNLIHNQTFQPLYDSRPQEFIAAQKASFVKFQEYPYLYFFGMGNGVLLKDLLSNPHHERIVVVEPDPLIIYVVFHLIDFTEELAMKRLFLLTGEQVNFPTIAALFRETTTQRFVRLYDLHIMSPYYEALSEIIHHTNHCFIEAIHHTIVLAGNDTKDALIGLKHHVTNTTFIPTTPPLYDLFSKAKTTDVAVLVSTGPSLGKQLELLKKVAPYVTIFAVDASLPVLIKNGIKPDVVTSIERVPLTARFFQAVPKEKMQDIVTVLSSLQHVDVINSVQGGQKVMSIRPLGYMRLTGPKEWGYIGIGMSAANMAYELIYHSQFKTCILIGQDLAYGNDGKSHASGHVFGEDDVKQSDLDGWTTAYGGQGRVKTTAVWNMFRGFFEKDIEEAKARMLTINATEGGAQIFGAQELPFAQAISLHVKKVKSKKPIRLHALDASQQKYILQQSMSKVEEIEQYINVQQQKTEALFLEVATLCDAPAFEQDTSTKDFEALFQKIALFRESFKDEIFDKVIWHIAQTMVLAQEIMIAPMEVMYAPDDISKKEKYKNLLLAYKGWLFSLAGCMDAINKTISYAKARSLIYAVDTIDVMLDDQKIDTITCKTMKAQNGRVFDVDMRGILYDVSKEFCHDVQHITFRDALNLSLLPRTFVSVFSHDDIKYGELSFLKSIETPLDFNAMIPFKQENSIGFLALEDNLNDGRFKAFIQHVSTTFPDAKLKAFYFNTKELETLQDYIHTQDIACECIKISHVLEMVNNITIYLSNVKALTMSNPTEIMASRYLFNLHDKTNLLVLRLSLDVKDSLQKWDQEHGKGYTNYIHTMNELKILPHEISPERGIDFHFAIMDALIVKTGLDTAFCLPLNGHMNQLNEIMVRYALQDTSFLKTLSAIFYAMILNNPNEN